MKILLVEPGGYAGTFQYTHNLANALAGRGHEVTLATRVNFETKRFPRKYQGLEVFSRFLPRPIGIIRLLDYLVRHNPHIVHIQGHLHPTSYLFLWYFFRMFSSAHFVYTAQDVVPKKAKIHHLWVLRHLYATAEHIFVNAHQNKRTLLTTFPAVAPEQVTVLPLPDLTAFVDTKVTQPRPDMLQGRKVILFFGNIEPRKGLMELIRAFPLVKEDVPEAFLLIVGKPFTDMTPYIREIQTLGLNREVKLMDDYLPLEELPTVFEWADVVALPYVLGWNSAVISTSYAHGKPVVVSDIGGFNEVVAHGTTGFLVPPSDLGLLAAALKEVLTNHELRHAMAIHIKERASLNSWEEVAEQTEKRYEWLASNI